MRTNTLQNNHNSVIYPLTSKERLLIWKKAKGILKNKTEYIEELKKMREEWNR